MSHKVREFVVRFSTDSKLSEKALSELELKTLIIHHFRLMHVISDVVVDLDQVEQELLDFPQTQEKEG